MRKFLAIVVGAFVTTIIEKLLKNKEVNDQEAKTVLPNPPKPPTGTPR